MFNETIELVDLKTHRTRQINVTSVNDFEAQLRDFLPPDGGLLLRDYDVNYVQGELPSHTGINFRNLLQLAESYEQSLETIGLLADTLDWQLEIVEYILDNENWYLDLGKNRSQVYRYFLENMGMLENVPEQYVKYLDYDALYQDDSVVEIIPTTRNLKDAEYSEYLVIY